jgi:NADPH-dependent 2,4-dienoyl-CoA reductase/sulfur reductase-like enzyme
MVVVGAGIIPNTSFIKGVKIERDQSVVCNGYLQAADNLWVAGDVARYPAHFLHNEDGSHVSIRVEHYGMAQYQGTIAARNMLRRESMVVSIPFFWTTQCGKNIRYCGHAYSYDDILYEGSVEEFNFVCFFIKGKQVVAAASMGRDPIVSAVAELMHQNRMPTVDKLKGVDLLSLVGVGKK